MADVYQNFYNPDVLSCLANLSNDEVFTPPEVANRMLDLLPQELFRSPDTTFLDPACKSGVFLREIAKRLLVGLENEIPDLQQPGGPYLPQAALRYCHHGADQSAFPPQRLLLEISQQQVFCFLL